MLMHPIILAETALNASTAEDASAAFLLAMRPLGATYLQTRAYRRPISLLTSQTHWAAGGFIARVAPEAWPGSEAFNYVCFDCNPLLGAISSGRTRYRFSDFAPKAERRFGAYWDAMSEADIHEGLCATSYGPGRSIASLHLGFEDRSFTADDTLGIQLAGLLLTEKILSFA